MFIHILMSPNGSIVFLGGSSESTNLLFDHNLDSNQAPALVSDLIYYFLNRTTFDPVRVQSIIDYVNADQIELKLRRSVTS